MVFLGLYVTEKCSRGEFFPSLFYHRYMSGIAPVQHPYYTLTSTGFDEIVGATMVHVETVDLAMTNSGKEQEFI